MNVTALKSRKEEQRPRMVVDRATLHYQTKSGPLHALDNVSLEVRDGEFLCIIGPSGCGKTTLLWSMAGLINLNGGEITLDGEPITRPNPQIAMIFQDANLLPWRTLERNIQLPFELKRKAPDKDAHQSACSSGSGSPASTTSIRANCRAACSSAPRSCGASPSTRRSCSWTSRSARSTPSPATR